MIYLFTLRSPSIDCSSSVTMEDSSQKSQLELKTLTFFAEPSYLVWPSRFDRKKPYRIMVVKNLFQLFNW